MSSDDELFKLTYSSFMYTGVIYFHEAIMYIVL